MPMTQKEMVKLLAEHGWIKTKGGKGSHIKMERPRATTYHRPSW